MRIEEFDTEVEDISDMNDLLCEQLDCFCQYLEKDKSMQRQPTEDDIDCDDWAFIWTSKACKLIEGEISNLYAIAVKYFGEDDDIEIKSSHFIEP